jgi:hypothetical protein
LPAHTEQRVVPSAICAPHILQKAMEVSSSCGWYVPGNVHRVSAKRCRGKVPKSLMQSNPQFGSWANLA